MRTIVLVGAIGGGGLMMGTTTGCLPSDASTPSATDSNGAAANGVTLDILRWGKWRATPGNFVYPRGIAVGTVDGSPCVVVTDKTLRIQRFAFDGALRGEWPVPTHTNVQGATGFPVGVAISPVTGHVLVANTHYNEIDVLGDDGTVIQRIGDYGNGEGQFIYPVRIAVRPDGQFYVTEYGHNQHRVQQFSAAGEFVRSFGRYGHGEGEFDRPNGICLDEAGFVYVADANNSRIQKFTADGEFVAAFGQWGDGPDGLKVPYGIAFDAKYDRLIVAEFGASRLTVFSREGRPLGKYRADFANPWDVAVAGDFAFVPDYRHHQVWRIPLADLPTAMSATATGHTARSSRASHPVSRFAFESPARGDADRHL